MKKLGDSLAILAATLLMIIVLGALNSPVMASPSAADTPESGHVIYLPVILHRSPPGAEELRMVSIEYINRYEATGEYVLVKNWGRASVPLEGWKLTDSDGNNFVFPSFHLQPGQECRIYTGEAPDDTCGLSFQSPVPIWDDTAECATLYNAKGEVVSSYCYR